MRFVGVDLAWRAANPSGVVALAGRRFPLALVEGPGSLSTHAAVRAWLDGQAASGPVAVGIDAPLLGLGGPRRRRPCDDAVSRAFGRFHAATHSPPTAPDLRAFVAALRRRYGARSLAPEARPRRGRPAIREVYPNALQVRLFGSDRGPAMLVPYKRRRFPSTPAWAVAGLGPFRARCRRAMEDVYIAAADPGWRALLALRPRADMPARALKAIEDGWDAVLCALAVAIEVLEPARMRAYTGEAPGAWRRGYIVAPVLPPGAAHP